MGISADKLGDGSSPLARGLRPSPRTPRVPGGIIPARAGFTKSRSEGMGGRGDHPRSRGVYLRPVYPHPSVSGSSPLARGLLGRGPQRPAVHRIIPARAGFTTRAPPRSGRHPDHPRSRGVYSSPPQPPSNWGGSSPLARGLLLPHPHLIPPGRIIPARAGFTRLRLKAAVTPGDHPRSRGVYVRASHSFPTRVGSSPLARGLHLRIVGIPTNP